MMHPASHMFKFWTRNYNYWTK